MRIEDVASILRELKLAGIPVWLDGGWCVDALVGRQLREHSDLDLAVRRESEPLLRSWLDRHAYSSVESADATPWSFTVRDGEGRELDIHVFEHDEHGNVSYGVAYPLASLAGSASLGDVQVQCIAAEWMFQFKTAYKPRDKDVIDVRALADRFGFAVPENHRAK